jgi:hypothetical protein
MLIWSSRVTMELAKIVCRLPQKKVQSRRETMLKATNGRNGGYRASKDIILRLESDKR